MSEKKHGFLKFLGLVLVIVVAVAAAHPLWLGPLVKGVANAVGPKFTKTEFRIGKLSVNLYTLDIELAELTVGNPEPYAKSEPEAAGIGRLRLNLAYDGLLSKRLYVEEFTVERIRASYLYEDGRTNVDVLKANATEALGESEKPAAEASDRPAGKASEKQAGQPSAGGGEWRIRVDRLKIDGVSAHILNLPLAVPLPIELNGIGASTGGVTLPEFCNLFCNSILNAAGNVVGADAALGGLGATGATNAVNEAAAAVGTAVDAVVNTELTGEGIENTRETLKATGKQLEKVGKSFRKMFKK